MLKYTYDPTPFIVLNSDRVIESVPFKRDSELFLFHSLKNANDEVLMTLLSLEHENIESTLAYCEDRGSLLEIPISVSLTLPMRITPRYELLDFNSDLQILLKWFNELLLAIQYLHSLDIIHSNLHPNACFLKNNRLILGELQSIIINSKYNINEVRQLTWAPEIVHEDVHPVVSKGMDIFMLGIILSVWLDDYLCVIPRLGHNYLPSKLLEYLEHLDDFMIIECRTNADLFPPIFKLISDILIQLMNPDHNERISIGKILDHGLISIINRPTFIQQTIFAGLTKSEWTERNIKKEFEKRKRPLPSPTGLWFK
eukprot:NODE_135_length_18075_cov_0.518413.p6 type:complete len:313 gc:universal NODE_135_length_18075_cov_0.518413:14946-15884(+)